MLNFNKKGILIFSQYRSGGTQLVQILDFVAECERKQETLNCGEFDIDLTRYDIREQIEHHLYGNLDDVYKIFLVNNPVVVSFMYHTGLIQEVLEDYEAVILTRNNLQRSLLSLGLWEDLIDKEYFSDRDNIKDEDLNNHYKLRIETPLKSNIISVGHPGELYSSNPNVETLKLNYTLSAFLNSITILKHIGLNFPILKIEYEMYEESPDTLINLLNVNLTPLAYTKVLETYRYKIPYPSENYLDYYDTDTTNLLESWKIKNQ